MIRNYKLACNFNTVEISDITDDDLLLMEKDGECSDLDFIDDENYTYVSEDELMRRLLQKEYDIIAAVKTANVIGVSAAPQKAATPAPMDRPSEKQIEWARNLGMDHPERRTRAEVANYIRGHK